MVLYYFRNEKCSWQAPFLTKSLVTSRRGAIYRNSVVAQVWNSLPAPRRSRWKSVAKKCPCFKRGSIGEVSRSDELIVSEAWALLNSEQAWPHSRDVTWRGLVGTRRLIRDWSYLLISVPPTIIWFGTFIWLIEFVTCTWLIVYMTRRDWVTMSHAGDMPPTSIGFVTFMWLIEFVTWTWPVEIQSQWVMPETCFHPL